MSETPLRIEIPEATTDSAPSEADHLRRRLAVLARATAMFSEAVVDHDRLLEIVARELSEVTGSGAGVRLLAADGQHLDQAVVFHAEPERTAAMRGAAQQAAITTVAGLWKRVIFERKVVRLTTLAEAASPDLSSSQTEAMRSHRIHHLLTAPMVARGVVLGGIALVRFEGEPAFTEEDELLAGDLASRAALAIDSARLVVAERTAREAAERAERATSELNLQLEQRVAGRTAELEASVVTIRQQESRFQAIFDGAYDAIVFTDARTGTIFAANRAAQELFGLSEEVLRGRGRASLVDPSDPRVAEGRARFEATGKFQGECFLLRGDGSRFEGEISSTALATPEGPRTATVIRNVTELKRAQRELLRAKETAEAVGRELESFSYSVAHDLRAPLRSIDGFSQALVEDCADKLDADGQKYLRFIRESAQLMAQLIDDILMLSRVTRTELHVETANLSALARAACGRLAASAPARQVEVVIEEALVGKGDSRLLAVVFDNLLGNSWKFTSKRDRARIEVGATSKDGAPAYFVRDDGAGFDMAYAGKLFGVFQRLHSAHEFEGTGVGLATVQRIIHRHGGRVWAEGAVGAGATFYFTLGARERIA